jgi:hypothetical protein
VSSHGAFRIERLPRIRRGAIEQAQDTAIQAGITAPGAQQPGQCKKYGSST